MPDEDDPNELVKPDPDDPPQIVLMKRMVELSIVRTRLARERNKLSEDRSRMSADRSRMSEDRSRMSAERSQMSADRSRMSAERSEMSETRSYHNAERTLSVWVRTALSLMVFGIAVDRFGLLLHHFPVGPANAHLHAEVTLDTMSSACGLALVALAILMSVTTGARFLAFARIWRRRHELPPRHGPYLATFFALMVSLFGIALFIIMLIFAE